MAFSSLFFLFFCLKVHENAVYSIDSIRKIDEGEQLHSYLIVYSQQHYQLQKRKKKRKETQTRYLMKIKFSLSIKTDLLRHLCLDGKKGRSIASGLSNFLRS